MVERNFPIFSARFLTRTIVLDMIMIHAAAQAENPRTSRKRRVQSNPSGQKARANSGKKICNSCPLKAYYVVKHLKGCFPYKQPSSQQETA